MSDFPISYLNKVLNIFTRLKNRQWANKERSLVTDEVIIIVISGILAYVFVSFFPEPQERVERITFYTFEEFLKSIGNLRFFFDFFKAIGNFFTNLSAILHRIFGPAWDVFIYIPSKIIDLIQFMIICLITFVSKLLSMISSPLQLFLNILSSIGSFINKFFSILLNLPGIRHLANLINLIIHDIIILLTSFFTLFTKFGQILRSFNLPDFLLSLRKLKFFNAIISFFDFIINFAQWLFMATIGSLLKMFHLDFLKDFIFNIPNYIAKFFNFLLNLFNIPKLLEKIRLSLKNLKIRFHGVETLVNILIGLLEALKWIILFPFFLVLKFMNFFSYILRSLTLDGIRNWWNNLCQEPGGCRDMSLNIDKMIEKIDALEKEIKIMSELINNAANTTN